MTLHERIAHLLGWTVPEVQQFSLSALRELVRVEDPALAAEITTLIASDEHVVRKEGA